MHDIVLDDRRLKGNEIAETLRIPTERVQNILEQGIRDARAQRKIGLAFVECRLKANVQTIFSATVLPIQ